MEGMVTISKDSYAALCKASLKLDMLEGGGVDNWDWYGESLFPEDGRPTFDDLWEEEILRIQKM